MGSPWHDILPAPPQHSYATTPPTEVLMRCAEKYDLERYTVECLGTYPIAATREASGLQIASTADKHLRARSL